VVARLILLEMGNTGIDLSVPVYLSRRFKGELNGRRVQGGLEAKEEDGAKLISILICARIPNYCASVKVEEISDRGLV
jgi:hypothetical protein